MPRITLYHLSDGTFELLVEAAARRGVSPEEMAVVLLDLSVFIYQKDYATTGLK